MKHTNGGKMSLLDKLRCEMDLLHWELDETKRLVATSQDIW